MTSLEPQIASTVGAAMLMVLVGTRRRALDWRARRRHCPSCGRNLRDCSCRG